MNKNLAIHAFQVFHKALKAIPLRGQRRVLKIGWFLLLILIFNLLSGCLEDWPLTSTASTNLDTRLLGVFEYDEPLTSTHPASTSLQVTQETQTTPHSENLLHSIRVHRVVIFPKNQDQYYIYYQTFSPSVNWEPSSEPLAGLSSVLTSASTATCGVKQFLGWISRVDGKDYLTFKDETPDSPTLGKYGFLRLQWQIPGNFEVFVPDLRNLSTFQNIHSSMTLRSALRMGLKAHRVFPYQPTLWQRIARISWDPKHPLSVQDLPLEFTEGSRLPYPEY